MFKAEDVVILPIQEDELHNYIGKWVWLEPLPENHILPMPGWGYVVSDDTIAFLNQPIYIDGWYNCDYLAYPQRIGNKDYPLPVNWRGYFAI